MTEFPLSQAQIDTFVEAALTEDVGPGDRTCDAVIDPAAQLQAHLTARENAIVCGTPLAKAFFRALDPGAAFDVHLHDGMPAEKGQVIAAVSGKASVLLTAERSALNSLQLLSGIATHTRAYRAAMGNAKAKLLDTRKTIPGYRLLSKYAAVCGGATNHRMGLYDAVMIKDNHIAVAGGVKQAIAAAKAAGERQIQVECDTLEQADIAIEAGATSLLLDNMAPLMLVEAVKRYGGRVPLEASGGITLETIGAIAATGVDYVSVGGALTLSAPAIDIGMDYTFAT
ncbi:MAG: carboxylating nicotinate-nucleotide diphosphorylase [Pseudomonadota bacterium]